MRIYAVLDTGYCRGAPDLLRRFGTLASSSVDAVQLRSHVFDNAHLRAAREMARKARKRGVLFLVNDRPDIALRVKADGVHLGKGDIPARVARGLLGPEAVIGMTVRSLSDARRAGLRYLDYLSIGPLFATPLKPGLRPRTRAEVTRLCGNVGLPVIGIGGIDISNVEKLRGAGLSGVAFVRYALGGHPGNRIRVLRDAFLQKAM